MFVIKALLTLVLACLAVAQETADVKGYVEHECSRPNGITVALILTTRDVYSEFPPILTEQLQEDTRRGHYCVVHLKADSDVFEIQQYVCELIAKRQPWLIVANTETAFIDEFIGSIGQFTSTPVITVTQWPDRPPANSFRIDLYPDCNQVVNIVKSVLNFYKWQKVMLLYETDQDLACMTALIVDNDPDFMIPDKTIAQITEETINSTIMLTKRRWRNFIVKMSHKLVEKFLLAAQDYGMGGAEYQYLFVDFDSHLIKVPEQCIGCTTKISTLCVPGSMLEDCDVHEQAARTKHMFLIEALHLIRNVSEHTAFKKRFLAKQSKCGKTEIDCQAKSCQWSPEKGSHQYQFGQQVFHEVIKHLSLVKKGRSSAEARRNCAQRQLREIEVLKLTFNAYEVAAWWEWNGTHGNVVSRAEREAQLSTEQNASTTSLLRKSSKLCHEANENSKSNCTCPERIVRVVTILEAPFVMINEETGEYEGYCVDLLRNLSYISNFTYQITQVQDGEYGMEQPNGSWSGMIGDLINGDADLALGPLSITHARSRVIGFTQPYMTLGIGILYHKGVETRSTIFTFLAPLNPNIWLAVFAAFLLLSVSMYFMARLTPFEWHYTADGRLRNIWSFSNSVWFVSAGLLQQGSEYNPTAHSTRMLASTWWFCALVVISWYTANLAAFLTTERMELPVSSAADLLKQTQGIKYGCTRGGSTKSFFKYSTFETYQGLYKAMRSDEQVSFLPNQSAGVKRVMESQGKFAFFMESTKIEYEISMSCNSLIQVGGLLDSKGYGIGTQLGSPLQDILSEGILEISNEQFLAEKKRQWWAVDSKCPKRDDNKKSKAQKEGAKSLGLNVIGGVFVILLVGIVTGWIFGIVEFLVVTHGMARRRHIPWSMEIGRHLARGFSCKVRVVPIPTTPIEERNGYCPTEKRQTRVNITEEDMKRRPLNFRTQDYNSFAAL